MAWNGRPAITWTYGAAAEIVARLANGLRSWRLAPGSRIGLALPGSSESFLAYLAVEAAGHIPCLLPLSLDEDRSPDVVADVHQLMALADRAHAVILAGDLA